MHNRIAEWKRIFDTEENAISKALSRMAWDLAAYSCVVEMVREAPEISEKKQLNGLVMDMLASGFWAGTMQGVRRLVEREPIRGPKSVCSLGGLISDIRAARGKLTREIYVKTISGLEYNYNRTYAAQSAFSDEQVRLGKNSYWVPVEYHYERAVDRHKEFDWLSGVNAGASRPDDLIRVEVFDMLDFRLSQLSNVIEHVNVEIAHAATEASREGRVLEHWGLADAKQALREIAEVAQLVGSWFCYSGIGCVLPIPQFDQFENLDQPLYSGEHARLQKVWMQLDREIQQWHRVDPSKWMNAQ
ncbi:hypothetical protein KK204_24375 [Pseudomonas aeruginosa]|uniref:hypothetical protein n=1 Tax=Pseudomonas aeruginosa TaxID=287 RepID=UPI000FFF5B24|nr:hypothetical protein [Pseudomonas aeruginosa]WCW83027.1 hypothetical protein KK204_24375 [Pseudomonas aeruginosa]